MPRRKKPLTSKPALGLPSRALVRRAQLRQQSPKRARESRERSNIAKQLERDHGRPLCEIRWDTGCTGWADDWDERKSRAAGGSITDEANRITACRHCHERKHANPAEARRRGLTLLSSDPDPSTEETA